MGILNFIKGQFIEVIEWTDSTPDTIVYRFPDNDKEIKAGAQLTVRESQAAVFVSEGQLADVFKPGRYELFTENIPVMTKLKSWKYGFNSPFKAEVYFVNTKQFTDQKWGTQNPIIMRDPEFGMLRLRAFGIFSFRVADPEVFLKEVFGTSQVFDTQSIVGQLKHSLVSGITDILAELKIPALDLATRYDEISEHAVVKLQPRFQSLGLQLVSLYVENISLPEEVEKILDKKTSMGVIGNMQQYAQFQAADSIKDAAQNQGVGGAGVGIGVGAAMGQMMGQTLTGSGQTPVPSQAPAQIQATCPGCKASVPAGAKFCTSCGQPVAQSKVKCIKCGDDIDISTKFCPQCGAQQNIAQTCSKCGVKLPSGSKFCTECGTKV